MTHSEIVSFLVKNGAKIYRDEVTGDIMMMGEALSDGELVTIANGYRTASGRQIIMVAA